MAVTVTPDRFSSESDAETFFETLGLHVLTQDRPARRSEPHWHDFDAKIFVVTGELSLTEVDTGIVHQCGPGALVEVDAGTMHVEDFPEYRSVTGLTVPYDQMSKPIDKPAPVTLG